MHAATLDDTEALALEIHALLRELDPAKWRAIGTDELAAAFRTRLQGASEAIDALLSDGLDERLTEALRELRQLVDEAMPDADASIRAWKRYRAELVSGYDSLSQSLSDHEVHVPNLRPTNYARSILHAFMATSAIVVLWAIPSAWLVPAMIPWIGFSIVAETWRRFDPALNERMMKVFAPVAHPHEWHRVNSATWYACALFLLAWADVGPASAVALAALGYGDPTAALVGRRYGRTELLNGRTLEGALGFVAAGSVAGIVVVSLLFPAIALPSVVVAAFVGSTAGAIAELVSKRVDDNFSIPLAAAAAAALALTALGVPLR
jgi:dolichol kinase